MEIEKKILVIDDEEIITNLFSKALALEGYKVLTENSGRGGINAYGNNLDILKVFCDTDMPDIDGFNTTAKIRKIADYHNRILDITLMSGRFIEKPAYVNEFLQKPILLEKLYESAARVYKIDNLKCHL